MRSLMVGLTAVVLSIFAAGSVVAQQPVPAAQSPAVQKAVADRANQREAAAKGDRRAVAAEQKLKAETTALAPKLVSAAGLSCNVADADNVASFDKKVIVEVACQDGFGYVIIGAEDGSKVDGSQDCIPADAPLPGGACKLAANANPAKALQPLMARAGSDCAVNQARTLGRTPTVAVYEVACASGHGEILSASLPVTAQSRATSGLCLKVVTQIQGASCKLTTAEANAQPIKDLAAKSDRACPVKDQRFVGTAQSGSDVYEIACQDNSGYMLLATTKGEVQRTVACKDATALAGGCKLIDVSAALATMAKKYDDLFKSTGYDCTVDKFESLKRTANGETIEFTCSGKPGSAVALIADNKAAILACPIANAEGYRCSLSKPEESYGQLTAHLKTLGRDSCVVSGARPVGVSKEEAFIEVACADGGQGFVVGYTLGTGKPKSYIPCSQAGATGGGCMLPGNKKEG